MIINIEATTGEELARLINQCETANKVLGNTIFATQTHVVYDETMRCFRYVAFVYVRTASNNEA